jgi:hypothetical protein
MSLVHKRPAWHTRTNMMHHTSMVVVKLPGTMVVLAQIAADNM